MLFRLLFFLLATGVVGYVAICALLYVRQERLIFFPSIVAAEELEAFARAEDFVPWTNARGERIGWQSPAQPGAPALLICHGNAGHALGRNYSALRQRGAFRIFLLEYPGYGARPGPPSARALVDAAVEAIDTLVAEEPGRSIYLFGQSLGSGVVSLAAARRPEVVAGVVLLTPFDSLAGAAARHYPWLPRRSADAAPAGFRSPPPGLRRPGRLPDRRPGRYHPRRLGPAPVRRLSGSEADMDRPRRRP